MNKYYFDFIKEKLKKDIFSELSTEKVDKNILKKEIDLYFQEKDITFQEIVQTTGTHQIRERVTYKNKENRCKARIWNEGEGGQCSCTGLVQLDGFCKTHFKKLNEDKLWLGTIDQQRPERPIHPDGKVHYWNHLTSLS